MQTYHIQNAKQKERVVLIIYFMYTIGMTVMSYLMKWHYLIPQILIAGMIINLVFHIKQYKTYRFRAIVTSCMIWIGIAIYGSIFQDMPGLYATMCCLIALIGIYGIPELANIGLAVFLFLMFYHARDIQAQYLSADALGKIRISLQISSIFLTSYAIYYLNKQQEKSYESLLNMIEDLEKAQQIKNDFMANISHEIRTPINTVCGISEIIMDERELSEQMRRDILDIQTAGRHLLSIISDILDFSELEAGKMALVEEPYNITSTINDVLNATISKNSEKNLEIIVDCDASIPISLFGDEQKIRRVISNMVDNAIKFTKEGGILLSVTAREESYGINLIVTVSDTGIGMSEAECERLFTGFKQVNTKRDRSEGGIGLGLAISQAIVEKMNGFITVNSTPDKGSRIQFVIPQKVLDRSPIISVKNAESLRVLGYIDMEKYAFSLLREGYAAAVQHMIKSLGIYFIQCRTLAELKRRVDRGRFSHIFISSKEYDEDKNYFDELALVRTVVVVLDRKYRETRELGKNILPLYKPFYVLPMASVLNEDAIMQNTDGSRHRERQFIAPDVRVLIVDDNPMNLRVMEGLLRPYQIKTVMAESGKEALEKIEDKNFDFVFMDHMMPGMDGVEAVHRIREKPNQYFRAVPIIALTANAIGGAREMFLAEGFTDFVAKPVEISVLERALLRHIPENKQLKISDAPKTMQPEEMPKAREISTNASEISLDGIDISLGMGFCGGNIDDYVEILKIYYQSSPAKIEETRKAYEEKDWKMYTIHAHSIKSMSMGIGAAALSDMAKELEAAARAQQEDYITSHNEEMLAEYERIVDVIGANRVIFPEELTTAQNLPEIAREQLLAELETLWKELGTFEVDGVKERLEQLSAYQFEGKPLCKLLQGISEKVHEFDFIGAGEDVATIIEKMR